MTHPTIFIDSSVKLSEMLLRKLDGAVRRVQAQEKCARKKGDTEGADRLKKQWVHYDEAAGMCASWMQDFLSTHRADVLRALIESWPRREPDIIDECDEAEECELAEAAD